MEKGGRLRKHPVETTSYTNRLDQGPGPYPTTPDTDDYSRGQAGMKKAAQKCRSNCKTVTIGMGVHRGAGRGRLPPLLRPHTGSSRGRHRGLAEETRHQEKGGQDRKKK